MEAAPMDFRSPPEDSVFPRVVRCRDRRSAGRLKSHLRDKKLSASSDTPGWSLRRLVLSTFSVNAVLWAATIFVVWWAAML
jgi:hypothetical protein